jgi:hypothetical protein
MPIDYTKLLYGNKHDRAALVQTIDSVLGSAKAKARMFVCHCTPEFVDRLGKTDNKRLSVSINDDFSTDEVRQYDVTYRHPEGVDSAEDLRGNFFLVPADKYGAQGVYTAIMIGRSVLFRDGLLPFFQHSFPYVTLTFITHKRLENLLVNFRDINHFGDFVIQRASTKTRMEERYISSVVWPSMKLEAAFSWLAEQNGWFQGLTCRVKRGFYPDLELAISRQGIVTTNRYFQQVYNSIIQPIEKVVHENVVLFRQRSRREVKNREVRPLAIELGEDLFESVEENAKFIGEMRKMKASSINVIHGNPYVHLSVLDYYDGSNFDIWVLSPERIIIVPQMMGSMQSIKRLVNHIFDFYAEGEVTDYTVGSYDAH